MSKTPRVEAEPLATTLTADRQREYTHYSADDNLYDRTSRHQRLHELGEGLRCAAWLSVTAVPQSLGVIDGPELSRSSPMHTVY